MNVNITGVYDYTDLYDNIILLQNEVSSLENKMKMCPNSIIYTAVPR